MTLSDHIAHALAHGADGPELYDLLRRARYGYRRRKKYREERARMRAMLAAHPIVTRAGHRAFVGTPAADRLIEAQACFEGAGFADEVGDTVDAEGAEHAAEWCVKQARASDGYVGPADKRVTG